MLDTFTCIQIVTKSTGLSNKQWNEGSTSSSAHRLPLVYNFGGRQMCQQNATQGEHQKLKLQSLLIKLTINYPSSRLPNACVLCAHICLSVKWNSLQSTVDIDFCQSLVPWNLPQDFCPVDAFFPLTKHV